MFSETIQLRNSNNSNYKQIQNSTTSLVNQSLTMTTNIAITWTRSNIHNVQYIAASVIRMV